MARRRGFDPASPGFVIFIDSTGEASAVRGGGTSVEAPDDRLLRTARRCRHRVLTPSTGVTAAVTGPTP